MQQSGLGVEPRPPVAGKDWQHTGVGPAQAVTCLAAPAIRECNGCTEQVGQIDPLLAWLPFLKAL